MDFFFYQKASASGGRHGRPGSYSRCVAVELRVLLLFVLLRNADTV